MLEFRVRGREGRRGCGYREVEGRTSSELVTEVRWIRFAFRVLTRPCSNLSRRRYGQNDETLYVAPEDERTDYVCAIFFDIASSDFGL